MEKDKVKFVKNHNIDSYCVSYQVNTDENK